MIVEAFTDPSTGYFNVDNVIGYLQNLSNQPSGQQQAWYSFESNLRPMRLRTKYDNLIGLSTHINSLQSQNEYFSASKTIDLSYYFIPFYKVPDSLFDVSSKEMRSYLKKNKEDYKQEESRSIDYAFFPLLPSKEDSLYFEDEIKNITSRLLSGDINDSTFALLNSDGFSPYIKYNIDQIPEELNNKNIGDVSNYKFENGSLIVYKLSNIVEDQNFKARAKHILLKFDDSNKNTVRMEAERVLSLVKNGSDFDETARTYSQDEGSASNGGDLNWFPEGRMVKPFEDAVFSRKRAGLIPRIIESEFGYHIIYVTQPKTKSSYVVTTISKEILPSDNTRNNVYRTAEMFKIESKASNKSFTEYTNENNKSINSENDLDNKASSFGNLENARSVVIWTYDDNRDINDLSEVIELDDGYVVVHVSDIKEEGTKNIDEVENSIRKKIIDDKKFNYLSKMLTEYESLDELKEIYENGDIYSMPDLTFNSNSLLNVGYSPEAVGVAFSMNENELTKPFKIDDGIIVIQLNNIVDADTLSSYDDYGISLLQANKFTSPIKIDNAIKMFSDIEDYRYKFF